MHIKKLFKSYRSSIYSRGLWSLEDDVLQDFRCSGRTALRCLLNIAFNTQCFVLLILTGTLPDFDEICERSPRFINSCLHFCYNIVRSHAHGRLFNSW